jgi:transposase-like protein
MSDLPAPQAQCPKCRNSMVYVTSLPYRGMRRTTYACYTCRQTRSYMLPETAGEGPEADSAIAAL